MTAPGPAPFRTVEVEACPACGARRSAPRFSLADGLHGIPGSFRYRSCRACGSVFQDPRVADVDLGRLYPPDYYARGGVSEPASVAAPPGRPGAGVRDRVRGAVRRAVAPAPGEGRGGWGARALARSRWLRERAFHDRVIDELLPWRTPAGRALDVGCGSGRLMAALAGVGWSVEGAEMDAEAAEAARRGTGLPVHVGSASSLGAGLDPYDLVVMMHVLEHLPSPVEAMANLARLLAPGGRLVVVCPNPESLLARRFGAAWYHWDAPRHLVVLPAGALARAGRRAGLELRSARTLHRWAADTWRHSLAREGGTVPAGRAPRLAASRGWGLAEVLAVAAGAPVGEEIVAAFAHPAGGAGGGHG